MADTWKLPRKYDATKAIDALIKLCDAAGVKYMIAGRMKPVEVFGKMKPFTSVLGHLVAHSMFGEVPYILITYQVLHMAERTGVVVIEHGNMTAKLASAIGFSAFDPNDYMQLKLQTRA